MESKSGFVGHRKAFIHTINNDGSYDIYYADDNSNNVIKGVNAVNVGSFGSGIFNQYHENAPVWVGQSYCYEPLIIGFANIPGSIEQSSVPLESNDIDAPSVSPGEIVIQSSSGAHIDLRASGDIKLSNLNNDGLFVSDVHRSIISNSHQYYHINDSGYTVEGRVKRFYPSYLPGQNPVLVDLLSDPEADAFTFDVARDPSQKAAPMNRDRGTANIIRNPPFAEKREMILEFADSFFVRDADIETELASEFPKTLQEMDHSIARRRGYADDEQTFDDLRHASRTNVLKLDNNVIIERVQGTLVDIFGNVLDINYNKLEMPQISEQGKDYVSAAHSLLNRSVAYHFIVNSRNSSSSTTGNGKFTFDIDKEGQFKLNVPKSSIAGTIPTLASINTSSVDINSRIDINLTQLSKSLISSPTIGNVGTAFHDMSLAADRLIRHSIKSINLIREHTKSDMPNVEFVVTDKTKSDSIPTYTTTVSVQPDAKAIATKIDPAFAGGRSGQINFEGSLEMSIGKDDVDNKSILLDTAGSIISWIGKDSHGRSAVVNTDGAILVNVGDYVVDDRGTQTFNAGSITIRVNLVDEKANGELKPETTGDSKKTSDHIIHISHKGILISSGNGTPMVFRSSGDLTLEAQATLNMKAKQIMFDNGVVRRLVSKKGDI